MHRKQIALAGMATGLAMTSIGIGGLIVGNAGAEEPGHSFATDESGVTLISPVSPVGPLEKSSTTPSQTGPTSQAPGSEAPGASDAADPVPASPRSIEESAPGSSTPVPARPTQVPWDPTPSGRPSDPTGSPSEPTKSPSEPTETPTQSPSEPTESPSEPTESPSESDSGEPTPSDPATD